MADANLLRAMRKDMGMTIRELEKATGINRGRLSIIERGVPPTEQERRAIVAALRPKADE